MKKLSFLLIAVLFMYSISMATIRRVGFFASPISGVDYATVAAAYTASVSGDTVLVFPGIVSINLTLTKKLIIIGTGDWLDPASTPKGNAGKQAFAGVPTVTQMIFNAGSEGSVVMGLQGGTYYVSVNNITLRRNRELGIYIAYPNTILTVSNLQVLENYRVGIANYYTNGSSITGMNISNNLMTSFSTASGNTYNGNISNNVWAYDGTQSTNNLNGGAGTLSSTSGVELGGGAYLLQNNIFASYTNAAAASNYNYFIFSNGSNAIFNNNLFLQSYNNVNLGVGTGNQVVPIANVATIFAAWPLIGASSADARYQLGASSLALTTGAGNTPIGMFTGTTPYKLSLIPTIPSIYQLSSPQGNNPAGSTIQISVSTRGNN